MGQFALHGGSTWSHLNLTIEGNREKVLAARRLFTKLWASFVDLSCGLDRIGVKYAIEWPKNCVYWSWDRVRKWLKPRGLSEVIFDGCRLGLKDLHGTPVKKPWRIVTSCKAIVKEFRNKTCRGGHSHAKCLKDSEDYTPKFALLVHQAFALQAAERRQNRCAVAALPAQPATPAILCAPTFAENMASSSSAAAFLADAASPEQETMQANMRRFLQRMDEVRPAGARANKQTPSWLIEALTKIEEPPADALPGDHSRFSVARAPEGVSFNGLDHACGGLVPSIRCVYDDSQPNHHGHHPGGLVMSHERVHRGRFSVGVGTKETGLAPGYAEV